MRYSTEHLKKALIQIGATAYNYDGKLSVRTKWKKGRKQATVHIDMLTDDQTQTLKKALTGVQITNIKSSVYLKGGYSVVRYF